VIREPSEDLVESDGARPPQTRRYWLPLVAALIGVVALVVLLLSDSSPLVEEFDCSDPGAGQDFSGVDLAEADFSGQSLECADFSEADLFVANFKDAQLAGAVFTGAFLRRASFEGADLRDADFGEANLAGTRFVEADLRGAHLCGGSVSDETAARDFTGADLGDLRLDGCDLIGGGSFVGASFNDADLAGVTLIFETVDGASFEGADLEGAVFLGVDDGEPQNPTGALWSNTVCPDGMNSDEVGGCDDHLAQGLAS
jgi:uncharacterized protein YjbI with pentapeptide repeats